MTDRDKSRRSLKIAAIALGALLLASLGTLYWQSYLGPQLRAQEILNTASMSRGNLVALNTDLITFNGQKLEETNVAQKALAQGSEATAPPAFIFTNDKDIEDRKILSYFLDFSDQRSRDALLANRLVLQNLVESGSIELRIHPVLGGRAYSIYAAEALAEVFASDSNYSWESLYTLLRQSPELASLDDIDAMADGIAESLGRVGVTVVDRNSIQNGTFSSWLLTVGDDPRLNGASQLRLPHILIGDKILDLPIEQLNDSNAFRRALIEELN